MYPAPCPCSAPPQAVGAITLPYAQKIAAVGLLGLGVGAFVSHKRYDWAAPGALLGGVLALGIAYAAVPRPA